MHNNNPVEFSMRFLWNACPVFYGPPNDELTRKVVICMCKRCELVMEQLNEGKYTGREILLTGAVLFLSGMVLGMLISPRKNQMIGSLNGTGSCNGSEASAKMKKEK